MKFISFCQTDFICRVKKRFPTIDHVIEAGLMRSDELKSMDALNEKCSVSKWWMPLVWATNIVRRAREENLIKSDPGVQTILGEISKIRHGLTSVQHYDTISVPLVYTQVNLPVDTVDYAVFFLPMKTANCKFGWSIARSCTKIGKL